MPSTWCTSNVTEPWARLAAKITEAALMVSVRIRPQIFPKRAHDLCRSRYNRSERHLATDFAGIEVAAIAGIFHRAPVHHREIVAELAGKVEILFDQHDRDVAKAAQIGDRATDVLDDRRLDALGRLVQKQEFWPHHQ